MATELIMNNFKAAWNHYRENVKYYRCDDGVVEFRYQDGDDGLDVVIQYIETDNNEQFHELLKQIIDDMTTSRRSMPFDTIILKRYENRYHDFDLHQFNYKNYKFIKSCGDCIMITAEDAE